MYGIVGLQAILLRQIPRATYRRHVHRQAIQPVPALFEFILVAFQRGFVDVSQPIFSREGRPGFDVCDKARGNQISTSDRPFHFGAANFLRVELYQGGGIQVEDHLRFSSTISESVFSPGPITIGRAAPRILPPLAGSIPGIRRRRRASSEASGFVLASGANGNNRAIGRPREVIITSSPLPALRRYSDSRALNSRTEAFMGPHYRRCGHIARGRRVRSARSAEPRDVTLTTMRPFT
jgi:hypothetical protein